MTDNQNIQEENIISDRDKELLKKALVRTDSPVPNIDTEWETLRQKIGVHRNRRLLWVGIAAAAAVVLLMVLVTVPRREMETTHDGLTARKVATVTDKATEKHAEKAIAASVGAGKEEETVEAGEEVNLKAEQRKDLTATLPDGSKVWLAAGSELKYQSQMSERTVRLSGEGYFDVHHDANHPFRVVTDWFTVTDIGTSFDVKAYSKHEASVSLIAGKASVKAGRQEAMLKPGECADILDGGIKLSETDTYPLQQRIKGMFYFHEQPLKDIMREIGRWYGINVVFENDANMNMRVHFVDERSKSLDAVIRDLNKIDGVQVFQGRNEITVR